MKPQGNHAGMRSLDRRFPLDEDYLKNALQVAPWVALAYAILDHEEQAGEILTCANEVCAADKAGRVYNGNRVGIGSKPGATWKPIRRNTWYMRKVKSDKLSPRQQLLCLIAAIEDSEPFDFSLLLGVRGADLPRSEPEGPAAPGEPPSPPLPLAAGA
jgi:hypothetical protein